VNFYRLRIIILFILILCVSGAEAQPSYIPAAPYTVKVIQPDGTELDIRGKGDEHGHFTVTDDGYTVIRNSEGFYEFARLLHDGKLDFSGIRARNVNERSEDENNFLESLPKFLKESSDQAGKRLKSAGTDFQKSFPSSGSKRVLLLLIEYPDLTHNYARNNFDKMMNQQNYNGTGSFRDYYFQASNKHLSLAVDVFGWYTAKNSYSYYGENNGDDRARMLVAEAVDAAEKAGVNFSYYDNDGDGYVDNLMVAHSGPGAEEGSRTEYIWSHSWFLGSYSKKYDGVTISRYIIQPETRSYGLVGIGVFCHEFGHALGLPDLYDTDDSNGDSEGLGNWCLMAAGGWLNKEKTPAMLSAWAREKLGWINPVIIDSDGDFSLTPTATGNACYKLLTPVKNEYFLLENRHPAGFDKALPGSGLAIFHINTLRSDNDNERLKLSDLEEADGRDDLDKCNNRGDAGDLFPGTSMNTVFNDLTYPDSRNYNGSPSGVSIYNIKKEGTLITFSAGKETVHGVDLTFVTTANRLTVNGTLAEVDLKVQNTGNQASNEFKVAFYLSKDRTLTHSDIFAGSETISNLSAGESRNISFAKDIREINPAVPQGEYYVGYIIDYVNNITEINEDNNSYLFSDKPFIYCLPEVSFLSGSFCRGDSMSFDGKVIKESGVYEFDYKNQNGCDSIVTMYLDVIEPVENFISKTICSGDSAEIAGVYYKDSGIYSHLLTSGRGCDSTVIMHLIVNQSSDTSLTRTVCDGDSIVFGDMALKETGIYIQTLVNQWGCDSLVTLDLLVNDTDQLVFNKTICPGDSAVIGSFVYRESGTYINTFSNQYGCDSTVVLELNAISPPEIDLGADRIMYTSEELILDPGPGYADYSWSTGHNDQVLVVNGSSGTGNHTFGVTVTNEYGCSAADIVNIAVYDDSRLISDLERNLKVFPNPGSGIINLLIEQVTGKYYLSVYTESGTLVYRNDLISPGKKFIKQLDLSFLATGIYTVNISSEDAQLSKKLIISGNR
jgi:M6 family metalloprotease-like protein